MSDLVYYCLVAAAYHATCAARLITALEDARRAGLAVASKAPIQQDERKEQ